MPSYSRVKLSGSTSGLPIKVAATATAGTLLHTANSVTAADTWDEVYIWITNTSGAAVNLTIEYGGVTDPDHLIVKTLSIPANSYPIPVLTGQIIQNSLVIRAFAGSANVLLASGYVNRIS